MIGMDPEFALVSRKTGLAKSAHQFLGEDKIQCYFGSTNKGKAMPNMGDDRILGSEADRDGPAVEVRSLATTDCRDNVIPYMASAMREVQLRMIKKKLDATHFLSTAPVFTLTAATLKNAPENVSEFGCNPDIDAYSLQPKSPELGVGDRRRYTGGHLHASAYQFKENDPESHARHVILMDYFIGLPLVAILGEKFRAGEAERRNFYGQAGSYRVGTGYGHLEYRVPSGRIMLSPIIPYWALGLMKMLVSSEASTLLKRVASEVPPNLVVSAINNHDVDMAEKLYPEIFKLHHRYDRNERIQNKVSGGGGVSTGPRFFETVVDVLVAGNKAGLTWNDDVVHNWGLYPDYEPMHHAYWGISSAMTGQCDELIFPQRPLLKEFIPSDVIYTKPIYTHPTKGGAKKFVSPDAKNWFL